MRAELIGLELANRLIGTVCSKRRQSEREKAMPALSAPEGPSPPKPLQTVFPT